MIFTLRIDTDYADPADPHAVVAAVSGIAVEALRLAQRMGRTDQAFTDTARMRGVEGVPKVEASWTFDPQNPEG